MSAMKMLRYAPRGPDAAIRSSCGAYELLFFDVDTKKQVPGGASATTSTTWENHTVKFGWFVDGIYPSGTDGSHINIVEMSKN